jgi:hypothetical protein
VQAHPGGEVLTPERRSSERLFHRDLPGGGYVAIEVGSVAESTDRTVRVVVERRSDRGRRAGHHPPVIHEEQWKAERGVGDLYRVACDNVAIARGLLRLNRAD